MSEDIILNYLIPIGGPAVLLWAGWLVLRSRKESIENRLTFAEVFRENFFNIAMVMVMIKPPTTGLCSTQTACRMRWVFLAFINSLGRPLQII